MKLLLQIFALIIFLSFFSEVSALTYTREATYYADAFQGKNTMNGEIFSQTGFTAATCDIPLGSNVYVYTQWTGTVVRINDRPNCTRYPNVIDFSQKIFSLFSPLSAWRIPSIQIDSLDALDPLLFRSLWVQIDSDIPTSYFAGDTVEFRGRVLDEKKTVFLFLQNIATKEEYPLLTPVESWKSFRIRTILPKVPGKYAIIIASGNSFHTDRSGVIRILSRDTIIFPDTLPRRTMKFVPRVDQIGTNTSISLGDAIWWDTSITQDTKNIHITWTRLLFDNTSTLRSGKANVSISAYAVWSGGSLDRREDLGIIFSWSVILDRIHEKTGQTLVMIRQNKKLATLKFTVPTDKKIKSTYYLTLPDGDVREMDFPSSVVGADDYLVAWKTITLSIPTPDIGTYIIESVQSDGIAYFNLPITQWPVWNVLHPISDELLKQVRQDSTLVENSVLTRINKLRVSLNRNLLSIDDNLNQLAQAKAEDMIRRNYVWHINPDHEDVLQYAKRIGIQISGSIGENIASGNISDIWLQDGLEESGSHRMNMLRPEWKHVGIGYALSGKNLYLVHIFSE